ncbi:glycosyltransferase family 2 protein [Rubrivirga sp. IMCC45206]|uniref:glycosyltransferase family 2 protein n=1 Tax=Rubrivirga sp. IMCC45206 TaxID=3391614 RepID=UPI00398FB589
MLDRLRVAVVIPARDEAASVGGVVDGLLAQSVPLVQVVVVDNGSRDATAEIARDAGATVVAEPRAGYGRACLAGLAAVAADPPDVVVFADADASDDPADLAALVAPIAADTADLVIGSRALGQRAGRVEPGALLPQARWGNALACALIRARWGARFTDLGPFRAIRWRALEALGMRDPTFGWTVEMQVRAVRAGLRTAEVPVAYRKRIGRSKITGTVNGTVRAGAKILWTVGAHAVRGPLAR